jgi:sugar O-acyltransferase (sialic acid O-acetyltransferase NeuD family)
MKRIVILGAGGLAREVAFLVGQLAARGPALEVAGFVVSDLSKVGPHDSEVLGDEEWLTTNRDQFDALTLGIGTPAARLAIAERLSREFDETWWPSLIHPNVSYDSASCRFGAGSVVTAGCNLTVNIECEPFVFINLNCTIGHESRIGRGSVVNPSVNISGGVTIGAGVLVGTGSQILQYRKIGDGATIGAGAVVTADVEPGTTVVGVPARLYRKI